MGNANTTRKGTVNTRFLRVRAAPSKTAPILGLLPQGAVVNVVRVVDGYAQVELRVGGASMRLQASPEAVAAYLQTDYLTISNATQPPVTTPAPAPTTPAEPVTPVQPAPTPAPPKVDPAPAPPKEDPKPAPSVRSYLLGLNTLGNHNLARQEAERGCKYFLMMNGFQEAGNLKRDFPDAIVMVRRFFEHGWMPSVEQVLNGLEGANHGPLIYTALNEADQAGQGGEDLRKRARLDIEVARRIKQINPRAIFAAGTFSMGTPDFTTEETCRIMREEYAPHYNSGLIGLDMHLYSPNPEHISKPAEHIWFERRWEFLFTKCGFDPNVRQIYCSETGLDQGGIGGFPAHGSNSDNVRDWARKNIALQNAPLVVGGKSYASPILGGAIFQLGGNGDRRWEGYNVASYLPVLRETYNGLPRTGGLRDRIGQLRSTLSATRQESPSSKAAAERLKQNVRTSR
jgi:hypothetical protein